MSNTTITLSERRAALSAAAKNIDETASSAMAIFEQAGDFASEIAVAQAIVDLRAMLTPEIMAPVMALMNTELGFATDRDPKKPVNGQAPAPYSVDVVKEVFIESRLRGFRTCGNEFNIISGRFYGAKNGFERKVRELTKGTCECSFDAPVLSQDGKSAKVKCRATWMFNGQRQDLGVRPEDACELSVKINAFMGADGAQGKAERKLYKRIVQRLTGRTIEDGEVNDRDGSIEVDATVTQQAAPTFGKKEKAAAKLEPKPEPKPEAKAEVKPDHTPEPPKETTTQPATAQTATQPDLAGGPTLDGPQLQLSEFMTDAGVSFNSFRDWVKQTDRLPDADSIGSWAEFPTDFFEALKKDSRSLTRCVTLHGTKAK